MNAAFSFGGTELVGLAAAETADPVKTLPKATKQVKKERERQEERKRETGREKEIQKK